MRRPGEILKAFLGSRAFYPIVFAACATPLILLLKQAIPVLVPAFWPDATVPWTGDLGVNPVETMLHATGRDALQVLFASLAITPLRRLTRWNALLRVRRMIGVWAFAYAVIHLSVYVGFDQLGDVHAIAEDVFKRRFIFVGMFAFVVLLLLAATSTRGMMRRLGRQWTRLHRLVYAAAVAGAVHFVWGQKADIREPLLWSGVLAVLLGIRVFWAVRARASRVRTAVTH